MPDQQIAPPEMKHAAPAWLHILWDELWEYLREVRIVAVEGGEIFDAPGGGKIIRVTPGADFGRVEVDLSVQGNVKTLTVLGKVA